MSQAFDPTVVIQSAVTQDDMILLTVPRRYYDLVIQTIAKAVVVEGRQPISGADQSLAVPAQPEDEENYRKWKRDDVRRLKRETDNATLKALFERAENTDGQPVGMVELEQATGKTLGQVRGDLIRLSTFAKKELGLGDTWPFRAETGPDNRAQYRVPENVRSWWKEA
jgi:hypothetical protein